jgi:acetyltransferase-like isoleucine patch superfamily enzyme
MRMVSMKFIIAAKTSVTKNIFPNFIVFGVSARVIKTLN